VVAASERRALPTCRTSAPAPTRWPLRQAKQQPMIETRTDHQ